MDLKVTGYDGVLDLYGIGYGSVAVSCEHNIESSGYREGPDFLE
jgi:hypothetical protein